MNSTERMIYDKYAYDKTFQYIFRVYMEFERRVNVTPEYDGLKYGECRCDLEKWQKRLRISEKQLRRALDNLTEDGVIKRTFKGLKGKGSSIYLLTRFEDTNKDTNKDTNEGSNKYSKINSLDISQGTNEDSNKGTKKGNTSKNNNLRIISKDIYVETSNEYRLSKYLFELIRKNNPTHKEPNLQTWAKHIDYMIRIDKRKVEDIELVITWCQRDKFWYKNILSTKKLREKYDQLFMQMKPKEQHNKSSEEFGGLELI